MARRRLAELPFEVSSREARWLVGLALGRRESELISASGETVRQGQIDRVRDLLTRRVAGEPFAYLAGEREFYGRAFRVDSRVLVPRPETEHLVEAVLSLAIGKSPCLLDVGTGSGAIAITLALERPAARVVASDRSLAALAVAQANGSRLGARVRWLAADLLEGLQAGDFDVIVSNPPYVAVDDPDLSLEVRQHEPHAALFAADHGYALLESLLATAAAIPRPGWLVLEIGAGQADRIALRARAAGFDEVSLRPDLAGHLRVAVLGRH